MKKILLFSLLALAVVSCKKDTKSEPEPTPEPPTSNCPPPSCTSPSTIFTTSQTGPFLVFKFKFDSTQARLDNFGATSTIPAGNAAFSPVFNKMSAHYIEIAPNSTTQVGGGQVLYRAPETNCGLTSANSPSASIIYCQSIQVGDGEIFYKVPISQITPGSYQWLRVSLAYQNYDIAFKSTSLPGTQWGTVASFVGFQTNMSQYKIKNMMMTPTASLGINGNYKQGYWGFEMSSISYTADGKAAGTTVVNPISATSPIPAGSCLVTGEFFNTVGGLTMPLTITGTETSDVVITVSLSTNKSFEWKEMVFDGYYQPDAGEFPVDMGIRGMIPKY